MKTQIQIIAGLLFFSFTVYAQNTSPISLSGKVEGVHHGKIYLQKFYNKLFTTIDSANIVNGKFHFSSNVVLPELYGLTTDPDKNLLFLFIEKNNQVYVEFNTTDYKLSKISGSPANDLMNQYNQATNSDKQVKLDTLLRNHPNSIAAVYILYRFFAPYLTPEELEKNIALVDPSFENSQYIQLLRQLIVTRQNVSIGKNAIDFSAADTSGKMITLSSHYGKYLLLDFWASWCGPCREENPNLVKAYNRYKDKGFDIFAVSLDRKKESWLKAIKTDQLTWTHVSDLAYWNSAPAKLYGVRSIPSNVLLDPSGKIVAKNLYGVELEKKLAELLKK
jgi:peroxiredoxin